MLFSSKLGEKWINRSVKHLLKECNNNAILVDYANEKITSIIQKCKLVGAECTALEIGESNPSIKKEFDVILNKNIQEFAPKKGYGITFLGHTLVGIDMNVAIKVYEKILARTEFVILSIPIETYYNEDKTTRSIWNHTDIMAKFKNLSLHFKDQQTNIYIGSNPVFHFPDKIKDVLRPMIAVYGIYKNEEKFIERFLDSVKTADEVVLCDTGSTDNTNSIISRFQESYPSLRLSVYNICVSPWRFDDARNTALSLVNPEMEICISLDIDEYLMDGWKEHLINNWELEYTRYNHKFNTIWPEGGTREHWHERIHTRTGYTWKLPVHEILEYNGDEKIKWLSDFWMYQKPDVKKNRSNYLPLLEQSVKERKDIWKSWSFLASETLKSRKFDEALDAVDFALKLDKSDKGYLNKLQYLIYKAQNKVDLALTCLNNAIFYMPNRREIRFEKAKYLHLLGRNTEAFLMIKEAEMISNKVVDYHLNQSAWNDEFKQWKLKLLNLAKKEGFEL